MKHLRLGGQLLALAFIAVILIGGPLAIWAQQSPGVPNAVSEWPSYAIPRQPLGHSVNVSGTEATLLTRAGATHTDERNAWLVRWGSLLTIQTDPIYPTVPVCVCLSLEDETARTTMGSGSTCGEMVEDGGTPTDGQGVCFRVVAPGRSIRVSRSFFGTLAMSTTSLPGYADSVCVQPVDTTNTRGGGNRGSPCRLYNDCVDSTGDAGTLDSGYCQQDPAKIEGAYVMFEAVTSVITDGGVVSISVEVEN